MWTVEDVAGVARLYHSATLLLADGTVLSLGGGAPGPLTNLNGEIFSPDYLFDAGGVAAPRPVITQSPNLVDVGDTFSIKVTGPAVQTLALMQFGSATHAINMASQRIELPSTVNPDGSLTVDLPDNANVLVPGYWMLFALDAGGTPSIAATIKIESDVPNSAPLVPHLGLGVALERNGDGAYDGYDDSYVLTPDAPQKEGSFISEERVNFSQAFHINFDIKLGSSDAGAEGVAFVLHQRLRRYAVDWQRRRWASVRWVYRTDLESSSTSIRTRAMIAGDHTNLFDTDNGTAVSTVKSLANIEDGLWHDVDVVWNGTSLTYSFDGVVMATLTQNIINTYFGGSQFAYFGFTGATGGASEEHKVRIDLLTGCSRVGSISMPIARHCRIRTMRRSRLTTATP